jgi:hypothetical protein
MQQTIGYVTLVVRDYDEASHASATRPGDG